MNKFLVFACTITSVCGAASTLRAEVKTPVLFDLGTTTSPIAESALRVTDKSRYESKTGLGWITSGQTSFDRHQPLSELRHGGNPMRPDLLYSSHANRLNRDGVASEQDMRFRIDVKPGKYRVHIWVGDLHAPLESLAMECNGQTMATGLSAKQIIGRSKPESTGLFRLLRFDADATDGRIELRFFGDETRFKQDKRRYEQWFPGNERVDSYLGGPWDPDRQLKFDPQGPFARNSVLAIRVAPYRPSLIRWKDGKLISVGKDTSNRDAFVVALNQGDFQKAESILNADTTAVDLRLRGYLALLGHPDVEGEAEQQALSKAQQAVTDALKSREPSIWAIEARDSLDIFSRARNRFLNRGMGEEGHFQENRKVVSMMRIFQPGDLLYFKALEYQGRALQMLDPHRWVYPSGDARAVWKKLIAMFPQNRFARFYLYDEWTPNDIWHHGDHRADADGAPQWAIAQREAWGLLLDVCEWWVANKQHPDGSIGGGWGDDVELVALFGIMGSISEGASESSIQLATDLIDGLWKYGGIDQSAGFYRGLLDAEHSAEWTGDTLPLMLTIDWENPIWIERATQTARLMRDLWMDYNDRGDLHFRNNFLGSISVGNEKQANDSYINFRAALPAVSVYRYNRNPVIGKLLVEWADAWLNDAMRTDREKPLGVFPAEVGFPRGELGGVNSPNWYTAAHPPGTVNYDWQRGSYYGYLVDLMLLAHEITGEDKYLEPFHLQKQLVDEFRANPNLSPRPGTDLWAGKSLSDGAGRGRLSFDSIWQRIEKAQTSVNMDEPPILVDKADVLKRMNIVRREAKRKWPVLTTETSATDRVGFRGIADPFLIMTGARDMKPSVTYSGVGRDFAAFVKQTDERYLNIVMYNFASRETRTAITPWKLDVGGTYRIRTGVDTDNDDDPDKDIAESSFILNRRGKRIEFVLAPRTTTVIEVRQENPGRGTTPQADLAVISQEIKYSIWTRDLQVRIHNVGSQAAKKIRVTFYEGTGTVRSEGVRKKIGEVTVPHLSWPLDLAAKSLTVSVPYVPTRSSVPITVVVDERESIVELCESNNLAIRRFEFDLEEIRAPRNRIGEIGGNVTGEILRGIR
ncbi:MAG: CARDB domain-containing protein [Pirellulaceae bacterium]|nr:CARDB domain-containing protein [Pirellulaceae bacterium]